MICTEYAHHTNKNGRCFEHEAPLNLQHHCCLLAAGEPGIKELPGCTQWILYVGSNFINESEPLRWTVRPRELASQPPTALTVNCSMVVSNSSPPTNNTAPMASGGCSASAHNSGCIA